MFFAAVDDVDNDVDKNYASTYTRAHWQRSSSRLVKWKTMLKVLTVEESAIETQFESTFINRFLLCVAFNTNIK